MYEMLQVDINLERNYLWNFKKYIKEFEYWNHATINFSFEFLFNDLLFLLHVVKKLKDN